MIEGSGSFKSPGHQIFHPVLVQNNELTSQTVTAGHIQQHQNSRVGARPTTSVGTSVREAKGGIIAQLGNEVQTAAAYHLVLIFILTPFGPAALSASLRTTYHRGTRFDPFAGWWSLSNTDYYRVKVLQYLRLLCAQMIIPMHQAE
jgi:hypothetical protein